MGIYSIELPDKRVVDIEADDESTAMRGAQEWHTSNPKAPEQPKSFWQRASSFVTGSDRTEFPDAPEFEPAYLKATGGRYDVALASIPRSAVTPDENAQLDILKKNIPRLETRKDKFGNLQLKSPEMADWAYLNKPGISARDADEIGTQTLATLPLLGGAAMGNLMTRLGLGAAGMGTASVAQDVIAGTQGSEQGVDTTRAAISAGLGGVLAPGVPSALAKPILDVGKNNPVTSSFRAVFRPEAEAARKVGQAIDVDTRTARGLTPDQTTQALARDDLAIMDTGGEATGRLARAASNLSPEAGNVLNKAVDERFESQATRTLETLRNLVTSPGNAAKTREELEMAARTARAPFYAKAYNEGAGGIMDSALAQLQTAPVMQDALKTAERMVQNRVATGKSISPKGTNGPTLEYWDQVKRALDDKFSSLSRSGERAAAADVAEIRTQLLDRLDSMVPAYKEARGVAATSFKASNALEAGEKFATQRFENETAKRAVARMTAAEKDLFREGYVSRIIQQVNETPDRRSIVNQLMRSQAERERMTIALGSESKAREFEAFVRVEGIMDDMRKWVQGGSPTAKNLMDILGFTVGGATGGYLSGDYLNPSNVMVGALGVILSRGGGAVRNRINANVANKVAQMLVSKDPAVMDKAIKQVAYSPMLNAIRSVDELLEKAGIGRGVAVQQGVGQSQ